MNRNSGINYIHFSQQPHAIYVMAKDLWNEELLMKKQAL